jgi:hypothetical protein
MSHRIEQAGQRLIKRAEQTIRECDEYLAAIRHWNERHPNEKQIAPDDVVELIEQKRWAQRVIRCVQNGEPIPEAV